MNKNILQIDLENGEFSYKVVDGVNDYIGGETLANFLLKSFIEKNEYKRDLDYFSLTSGPLNGLFPYTSKAVVTHFTNNTKHSLIGGGSVGALLNLSNVFAIEIVGKSTKPVYLEIKKGLVKFVDAQTINLKSLGLAGRRFVFDLKNDLFVDGVFNYGPNYSKDNNLKGFVFSFDSEYIIKDLDDYNDVVLKIREREKELSVSRSMNYSCFGCPMACDFSTSLDTNKTSALTKSLIGCGFADSIYRDINLVFLCFQSLRFSYNHEFLEFFPQKAGNLNKSLDEIILKLQYV